MILCASEIFLYLDENLKLTPQAMSDKAAPVDELEDMHQRVGILKSSSLLHCLFFFSFFFLYDSLGSIIVIDVVHIHVHVCSIVSFCCLLVRW